MNFENYKISATETLSQGKKKREGGTTTGTGTGANEIVACTNCGPNPCTHTATNGCAAEVRKEIFFSLQKNNFKFSIKVPISFLIFKENQYCFQK